MIKIKHLMLIIFSAVILTACNLSNLATKDGMSKVWTGAQELNENLETYNKVNKTINTVDKAVDVVDTMNDAQKDAEEAEADKK